MPDGWLPLLFTTLGAGVAGSVITTYGAQGRVRREARSRALEALELIESARRARKLGEGFDYDRQAFAELEARYMVAGVPRRLICWFSALSAAASGHVMNPGTIVATFDLNSYSSFLIQQSLRHPYLSRIALPFELLRMHRAVDRCSKIRDLKWLRDVDREQELSRLGRLRSWIKEVEHQQGR